MAPMIEPDFSQSGGAQPGTYLARIAQCEERTTTSPPPRPYLSWRLEVDTGRDRPMTVFHNTPFSGPGAGLFRELVQAAFDPSYESGPVNTDLMLGSAVEVDLDYDPRNEQGKKYLRVMAVRPVSRSAAASF